MGAVCMPTTVYLVYSEQTKCHNVGTPRRTVTGAVTGSDAAPVKDHGYVKMALSLSEGLRRHHCGAQVKSWKDMNKAFN